MGINTIKSDDKKIMWWNDECKHTILNQNIEIEKNNRKRQIAQYNK